ncbi:MAG: bifunctional proline dehydrogenase/L-glutamate gamma-semialdehyde dehydrogenase PutA [Sphingobium sp.]|uniref:bifunctional proline dehydrogenase/L-glutamate gamma-semialdehyde dehydrogenase PutA n=1 Tax=Sphingobium sp. TaxID=1912891 RepID=UPI0029ADF3E7|nr:bifunctional proline dehydrogenase/L-glutamate gamma-semialdehyde dehydrogenase PutA [Sphingobium sp.]MDX3909132.1 bifunctional proline dehydrogenase/L-glutamate gamma-semialdehyde dehydrogenase PutA [Sphingobium sp.]
MSALPLPFPALNADSAAFRQRLPYDHRRAEPEVLRPLIERARLGDQDRAATVKRAKALLKDLRAAQTYGWVNQFLQEYRMNTAEGIALLSLAEAFLRVPDPDTADQLIADKIGEGDWRAHSGKSHSGLVNGATWGLVLGRVMVREDDRAGVLRKLIGRAGEPFVRTAVGAAMRLMGEVFVMGRTIEEAIRRMDKKQHRGFTASFDMLGEGARTYDDAARYFDSYGNAIREIAAQGEKGHSISVKLSALHPRYEASQSWRCIPELTEMLLSLAKQAAASNVALTVDAEESQRLVMSLDIIETVARHPELRGWDGLGMAIQAYSKRARAVVGWADAVARDRGTRMAVRLVKGAYWDSEIKFTQERGLSGYPLFTRKAATDVSYLASARDMLDATHLYPAFASHNALTVATILQWAGKRRDFEFQRLHGMGEGLYERLVRDEGHHCRIYAPVGGHQDLLAYLVRRLLENGANSSFVHQLADAGTSEDELLADPVEKIARVGGAPHPAIPLPRDLFAPERANSAGVDLEDRDILAQVMTEVRADIEAPFGLSPSKPAPERSEETLPAAQLHPSTSAGRTDVDVENIAKSAFDRTHAAFPAWAATPLAARAECLDRLADLMEERRPQLMAIACQEAFKTIPDALGEVREAVDFCRYYAAQARQGLAPITLPGPTGERNVLRMEGRGVWICIAPWNFPLAIFIGQVAAALVTGNTVVAKPAPQTPLIAAAAVALAHEAGVPVDALVLAPGGAEMGKALTADPRIAGVAFTGSVPAAKAIARALLEGPEDRPIVPLIAETGGINAMIVDSTALPEQVVRDIIVSGFQSAGQRCSALRLLLVQEEVLDRTLHMLKGAMDALVVGDPTDSRTDVGPVIDRPAYDRLMAHREASAARIVHSVAVPKEGLFVPPTVIRLDNLDQLDREVFGPIVHVATWRAGELEQVIRRVNAKRFGLTMGLHSRIARTAGSVEALAEVGNLYVNRSMIGAVVGSQPFGGEGLSGTGPKAGGPHYLHRFCAERVTSTDTTSAGGNASLLSLEDEG